jgi:hypothetical protein
MVEPAPIYRPRGLSAAAVRAELVDTTTSPVVLSAAALTTAQVAVLAAGSRAAIVVGTLPLAVDLILYRGDDFYVDLTLTDEAGDPWDLTGWTAASQIRPSAESDQVLASFTATIEANVIGLHLPHDQAQALTPGASRWDVQITDPTDRVLTLVAGAVTVTADVTRESW